MCFCLTVIKLKSISGPRRSSSLNVRSGQRRIMILSLCIYNCRRPSTLKRFRHLSLSFRHLLNLSFLFLLHFILPTEPLWGSVQKLPLLPGTCRGHINYFSLTYSLINPTHKLHAFFSYFVFWGQ